MAERGMTESGSEMAGLRGEKQRKRGTFVLWFSFGQGKGVVAGGFGKRWGWPCLGSGSQALGWREEGKIVMKGEGAASSGDG